MPAAAGAGRIGAYTKQQLEPKMNKAAVHTALIALAAFAGVYFIQKTVMKIPVVGVYLPGGQ